MKTKLLSFIALFSFALIFCGLISGCGGASVKKQGYAQLSNTKEFEEEYPVVWKAALAALEDYKITEKDQDDGEIETDWVYTTSNEKYIEYQVNGFPRKKYLQTRFKIKLKLQKQMGSVKATAELEQENEKIKSDGTSDGWKSESEPDSSRANEVIRNIDQKLRSRP